MCFQYVAPEAFYQCRMLLVESVAGSDPLFPSLLAYKYFHVPRIRNLSVIVIVFYRHRIALAIGV